MNEWISVEDRLPEPDSIVLIYSAIGRPYITDALFQPNKFFMWNSREMEYLDYLHIEVVSHWMPLPEPPNTPTK